MFQELNNDQRRETINTRQRFDAWTAARRRADGYRGSMVWAASKGTTYLRRSYYDRRSGRRKQTSLGPRSPQTERLRSEFVQGRTEAATRLDGLNEVLARQAAVNRVLGLGRVPAIAARIMRALDESGLLGSGIRVVGTNAIYAYEAAAGVFVDAEVTTTEDIDLLLDARAALDFVVTDETAERSLIGLLRRVDRSFVRAQQPFHAENRHGYLVDLIKPLRSPLRRERNAVAEASGDIEAVEIAGLAWLESAPAFESVVIDERGAPARMVAVDPRVFAVHKLWLSARPDRAPVQRSRDAAQAETVAALVVRHLQHLEYKAGELTMLPRPLFENARPLFETPAPRS